jgi:hypothetical protein
LEKNSSLRVSVTKYKLGTQSNAATSSLAHPSPILFLNADLKLFAENTVSFAGDFNKNSLS